MSGLKVLVTGATGFVGRHLVAALLARGHDARKAQALPWIDQVEFVAADVHAEDLDVGALSAGIDVLAHLAWPGLPNYQALFHFEHPRYWSREPVSNMACRVAR